MWLSMQGHLFKDFTKLNMTENTKTKMKPGNTV